MTHPIIDQILEDPKILYTIVGVFILVFFTILFFVFKKKKPTKKNSNKKTTKNQGNKKPKSNQNGSNKKKKGRQTKKEIEEKEIEEEIEFELPEFQPSQHLVGKIKMGKFEVNDLVITPDGKSIAVSTSGGNLKFYSVSAFHEHLAEKESTTQSKKKKTKKKQKTFVHHTIYNTGYVTPNWLSFTSSGRQLLCGCSDCSLILYSIDPSERAGRYVVNPIVQVKNIYNHVLYSIKYCKISPKGDFSISMSNTKDSEIDIYKRIRVDTSSIEIQNQNKKAIPTIEGKQSRIYTLNTNSIENKMVDISSNSELMAIATATSDVRVYSITKEKNADKINRPKKIMSLTHKSPVNYLNFSKDTKFIVTSTSKGLIKLWDLNVKWKLQEDPRLIYEKKISIHPLSITLISPDQELIAVVEKNNIFILNLENGEPILKMTNIVQHSIKLLVWSLDSKLLIAVGDSAQFISVWKVK
ncbi:transducin beta-like protein [Anaeramoeba flamelloides]|uniref:Transducin beta-like protein n=1 Tax=Anaeramoeba flamelloides TaxID=1746091 RepID=A0ABQ8XV77_9EUKA|nr:transducin beta-like protein [Anaeramoeba flamelloides]